ncbi:MAG: pyruvate kinase [Flavobacteriaceae bacterium]|nr:pyruvate kinase [Flavobacteriaceae bacterium]
MSQHHKKTKIVATLGPACNTKEILKEMIIAGVNVFRVNFSHAVYDEITEKIRMIRELNNELDFNVAILADLQGPKLRVGEMENGVKLSEGDLFTFTTEKCIGTQNQAYMTYQAFPNDVKVGENILVDDGKLLFEVLETNHKDKVTTRVLRGGKLKSKKGVNLPNTNVSLPALTDKDKFDVEFAIKHEVDWIALSFVRTAEDVLQLRAYIDERSTYKIPIIAKIEKPEALVNISKILPVCDALMVARGDLGVEIPMHEVPLAQKKLVRKAKEAHKPVIIATQMMETMISSEVPTRAEVNDVANSIMDGADAVMLSGETSVGEFPVEVIKQMRNIIESVEDSPLIVVPQPKIVTVNERFISKTICHHAVLVANEIEAKVISTLTNTGYTAFQISAGRPQSMILAFTNNKRIMTMLNLLWGVKAYYYEKESNTDETVVDINMIAIEKGYLEKGDFVVNLSSMPIKRKGMVNTLRITQIKGS